MNYMNSCMHTLQGASYKQQVIKPSSRTFSKLEAKLERDITSGMGGASMCTGFSGELHNSGAARHRQHTPLKRQKGKDKQKSNKLKKKKKSKLASVFKACFQVESWEVRRSQRRDEKGREGGRQVTELLRALRERHPRTETPSSAAAAAASASAPPGWRGRITVCPHRTVSRRLFGM